MSNFLSKHPKLQLFFRKRVLSLKRNYYTLPFIIVCIACFFYLCCMFIINKSVGRCDHKFTAIYLFASVLTSILTIVALISFTKKEYGQKRSVKMLIVYSIITAICLAFTILVFYFNEQQILSEIKKRDSLPVKDDGSKLIEWYTYQTYVNYGVCTRALLIVFLSLEVIANGLLIAGPVLEKKLQKIHFDRKSNERRQ